jgi:hypothetical protein
VFVVMTNLRITVFFAMAMIPAGCYDAPTVAPYPGPWLIDNFSDSNGYPTDPHFEPWGCRPSDEAHPIGDSDCNTRKDPDPASGRTTVLHLGAWLYPMSNGDDTFTRAEVATYVRNGQEYDLRPYAQFTFSWKIIIDPNAPLRFDGMYLKVQIFCTRTPAADSSVPLLPFLLKPIQIFTHGPPTPEDNQWRDGDLRQLDFGKAELSGAEAEYRNACLAHADGIKFTIDSTAKVYSGSKARFDLYVDDIILKPQ